MAEKRAQETRAVMVDARDLDDTIRLLKGLANYEAIRLRGRLIEYSNSTQATPQFCPADEAMARRMAERAREIIVSRRRRRQFFNNAMFGEPAWEMLLALYAGDQVTGRQTITRLAQLSNAPLTTALRWIDYLEGEGFICRESNTSDARSSFARLTDKARDALNSFFSEALTRVK